MFDLNKTPTLVEGEGNPQDSGTEKMTHIQANSATSAAPDTLARNYTFDSSELAELLLMVQDLPNDHPSNPNLMLNSNHARLPPYTSAFSEAPATVRRSSSSAVSKHLAMVTTTPGDGARAVRDVIVRPLQFKHGPVVELWSRDGAGGGLCGNQNQASQCQITMDMDRHVVSDGESDSWKWRNSRNFLDNSNSKAVVLDLDTLPDENPVELQFPRSPVHQAELPFHSTVLRMSSLYLQVSATEVEEEHLRLREMAFHEAFKLETQRCTPTARCRSCLAFCQVRLPKLRLPSLQEGCGPGGGLQLHEECPPVLRNVVDDEAGQARKTARHGPKSKSSEYRGVTFYKRTGRWEAHIWHEGAQVYLGSSGTKEEAARAYDQAALMMCGLDVDTNFTPESYQMEMAYLYKLSKEQLVIYLRRDSRGFGAQASYPGVRHVKNVYHAMYRTTLLGTFAIEEDAARAVYKEAVRNSYEELVNVILDTHHVRNMPSYAAQRFAALYPEAVEGTQLRNQAKAITCKSPSMRHSPSNLTTSAQYKNRSTRQASKPNQDFSFPPAAAGALAAPPHPGAVEQLPGNQVNAIIEVSRGALTPTSSWGADLAPGRRHPHAACINMAAQHFQSHPQSQPSNCTNTLAPAQMRDMLPKFVRVPASSAASSSCHTPSVPSTPRATGETSSSGVIKFKLFNVEISVAAEPGHGGDRTEAHGESEPQLHSELFVPQRKKRKITGAAAPATPNAKPKKLCK